MAAFLNHYSLLLAGAVILLIVSVVRLRQGWRRTDWLIVGGLMLGMLAIWLIFRPTATSATGVDEVDSQIGAGTPVLLELQSPF